MTILSVPTAACTCLLYTSLAGDELTGAGKVLRAAAMTYVAALLTALAQLLRLILIFGGRRRDD